jgi:hypothetical protein
LGEWKGRKIGLKKGDGGVLLVRRGWDAVGEST